MDVVQVCQAVATAIVAAMATDAWVHVRSGVARLWSGGDSRREQELTTKLDKARRTMVEVDEHDRARRADALINDLRGQLEDRLRQDPQLVEPFHQLAAEISERTRAARQPATISQYGRAGDNSNIIQVGGDMNDPDALARWHRPLQ
jgi:hypothetical protein